MQVNEMEKGVNDPVLKEAAAIEQSARIKVNPPVFFTSAALILAFALFGLPGAAAYRAINTLDSMIGYHGSYEFLGKTAARLDDLVNLLPSRVTGIFIVVASALLPGQNPARSWRIMWRDHRLTASPNAGWPMSGMAGSLGVQLEKVSEQGGYRLGDPSRPVETEDITRSVQSMYLVAALGLPSALGLTYLRTLYLW